MLAGRVASEAPPSPAAALVALFEADGEARVVLIRRSAGLLRNPGEIAFPGGWLEPGETMIDAALREAEEEVALDAGSIEIVGWLDRVTAGTSGSPASVARTASVVTPVVGVLAERPHLVAAPAEVEAVFDVPLSGLLACCREEIWDLPTPTGSVPERSTGCVPERNGRTMYFFDLGEDTIWGMTARVLYQLLAEVTSRTGPRPEGPGPGREGTTPLAPA